MKPRNLLIAAVLLAGLSGAVWWSKQHPPSTTSPATAASPKLVDITDRQIQSIQLKKKDGTLVSLDRQGGRWAITSPEPLPADQDAATSLSTSLNPVSADSVVEEKSGNPGQYGLNTPSLTVTIRKKDGKSDEIEFGDDVPAGSMVYARVNASPKVYAVSASVKSSLDKSANDLRDKRLLTFDQSKLTRIELTSGKSSVELGKNNANDWQIVKPQPSRADSFQVEELLRKLTEAKMDLAGSLEDAKKAAGLFASGHPVSDVKVTDASGTQTLDIRKSNDDYYAKSSVVAGVYKVSAELGKELEKNLDDFRNKKIFDFGFSDPTRIDVQQGASDKLLVRSGTDWKAGNQTLDPGTVQSFIDKVRDLSATKFGTTGFGTSALTVTVTSNDGKRVERVEFAKTADGYLARRENEPALYQVDAKPVNDMLGSKDAIKPSASSAKK